MKSLDGLLDALRSLRSNKMRSVLTTLGIIIGVGAVIVMVSVGNGAKEQINAMIDRLGGNVMVVRPGSSFGRGVSGGSGSLPTLTEDDAMAIQNEIPTVNAILGETVAENLFPDQDPIGQSLRINRVPFVVIGVLQPKGQTGSGRDEDDTVMLPISTARKRVLGGRKLAGNLVDSIYIKANSAEVVTETEELVAALLRERHRIGAGQDDDFRVRNMAEFMNARADSSKAMGLLLMTVASISLVVGGIGIMNIMLVSVTERTREIGLRMAVGATSNEIMSQFLIESIVLSLIGGIIGIVLGIGGSFAMSTYSQWKAIIDPKAVLLAFSFSAAVGVFFGFYPARKASLLDPIDALRHE
ncbi:MAG: ABC transporter permease [Deltaproteobacteria bacterium]